MLDLADTAGDDARVPTCPSWTVRALLAHQAMVHRWATATVRGTDPRNERTQTDLKNNVDDLRSFFAEGVDLLTNAIEAAPVDLDVDTFLRNAPSPREFWARRQAQETTLHMVDALSAVLGRVPTAAEADLDADVAVDGIDELLRGFFTRGKSGLFDGERYDIAVLPTDAERRWLVHVDETLTVTPDGATDDAAVTISGSAAEIHLGLWNRGDGLRVEGRSGLLDRWRETQQIRW
jgi:uncharacterized protein (TIGR03083 family)